MTALLVWNIKPYTKLKSNRNLNQPYSWSWLKYSCDDNWTIFTYGWLLVPSLNWEAWNEIAFIWSYLVSFILFWALTVLFPDKVLRFAFELVHFGFSKITSSFKNFFMEKVSPCSLMLGPVKLGTMGSPRGSPHVSSTSLSIQSRWRSIRVSSSTKKPNLTVHSTRRFSDQTVSAIFGTKFR